MSYKRKGVALLAHNRASLLFLLLRREHVQVRLYLLLWVCHLLLWLSINEILCTLEELPKLGKDDRRYTVSHSYLSLLIHVCV